MPHSNEHNITPASILLPLSILSFAVLLFFAFQTSLVLRERDALHDAITQQNKPIEDANKLQTQFSALALGTKKIAAGGNKNAAVIVDQLKKAGIVFEDDQPASPTVSAPSNPKP